MTENNLPRQGADYPAAPGSFRVPAAPGGGLTFGDETLPSTPIPPGVPRWPGTSDAVVEPRRRVPVLRLGLPPVEIVEEPSTKDRLGCAAGGALLAVALLGCCGGVYAASQFHEATQQPLIVATSTPNPNVAPAPTSPVGATATPGSTEACVVTPVFNQAPDGSPIAFTVEPGHSAVGGLWWEDGQQNGLPWGNAEVGIDIQGGTQGEQVTTEGNAGGALWDYSAGCSDATVKSAQAKYDAAREAVTNFGGDESLQSLQNAGALSVGSDPAASRIPALDARKAASIHDRIAARTEARLAQQQTPLSKVKGFLGA